MVKRVQRAQVTIFVIIAIVIVGLIGAFFLLRNNFQTSQQLLPADMDYVINEVDNCLKLTLMDGTKLLGMQGGYIIPPQNSLKTNFSYIAWGYFKGENTLNSESEMEEELAAYIQMTMPICFNPYSFSKYKIEISAPKATAKIEKDSVSTSLSFPFTASKDNETYIVNKKYSAQYDVNLGDMRDVAQKIVEREIKNPEIIDFSYLHSFNYSIQILNNPDKTLVYEIADLNPLGSYIFRFANKLK